MEKKGKRVQNIFWLIVLIVALVAVVAVYKKYNYNDFVKNISEVGKSSFTRDSEIK